MISVLIKKLEFKIKDIDALQLTLERIEMKLKALEEAKISEKEAVMLVPPVNDSMVSIISNSSTPSSTHITSSLISVTNPSNPSLGQISPGIPQLDGGAKEVSSLHLPNHQQQQPHFSQDRE